MSMRDAVHGLDDAADGLAADEFVEEAAAAQVEMDFEVADGENLVALAALQRGRHRGRLLGGAVTGLLAHQTCSSCSTVD